MLKIDSLYKHFRTPKREITALAGIELVLEKGDALGIVGTSGSGKSTLAKCIVGVESPSQGRVLFQGQDITGLDESRRRRFWRQVQLIWQDPFLALSPHRPVWRCIAEPLVNYESLKGKVLRRRVDELLVQVGLVPDLGLNYIHQLSGGQCQRVCIARALALRPSLLICDEPVSALDLPMQLHIMELIDGLRREMGLTLMIITHDLGLARRYCTRIIIMDGGRIVESGPTVEVMCNPQSPHTRSLLAAVPKLPWHGHPET